jgi:cell filamentation protein
MPESSDPYTYPGTDVLRNLLDIHNPGQLAAFEANATAARLIELDAAPLAGGFDVTHLKAIHRYIFQDVYPWAGEFRTVNISKGGHLFGAVAFVEPALHELLRKLPGEQYLERLAPQKFSTRAGYYIGELNAIHQERVQDDSPGLGFASLRSVRAPQLPCLTAHASLPGSQRPA